MKTNRTPKQTIKMVARNPITRKMETVYPEDEVTLSEMQPRFWSREMKWVSIPGWTAEMVYTEWLAQVR